MVLSRPSEAVAFRGAYGVAMAEAMVRCSWSATVMVRALLFNQTLARRVGERRWGAAFSERRRLALRGRNGMQLSVDR